jgi:hypothetical protein
MFAPGTHSKGWKKCLKTRLQTIAERVNQASVYTSPTHPMKPMTPRDLAALLGVTQTPEKWVRPGATFLEVVFAFINRMLPVARVTKAYRDLVHRLDKIVPRWVNRSLCVPRSFIPYGGNGWRPLPDMDWL